MKRKTSLVKGWILVSLGVTSVVGGLAFYKYKEITAAIEMAESFPEHYEVVEAAHVEKAQYLPTVSVLGNASSPLQMELSVELSGKVSVVGFSSGQKVSQGELLFQLDIKEEQAKIRSAQARERHANSVFQRFKKLLAKKAVSQEQRDQAYADLVVIQSEIDVLRTTISRKTIIAPFDGVLGMHNIKAGDYLTANQAVANFVGDSEEMWIDFSVPQFYPHNGLGTLVKVRNIDAVGEAEYKYAEIIARDSQISELTRSLKYRATINRIDAGYTPNMPIEVLVPISAEKQIVKVPVSAVNQGLYGTYVMRLNEQDPSSSTYRAEPVPVKVIAEKDGVKFISQGIDVGEKIAAAGAFKLYQGILVRVNQPMTNASENIELAGN